VIVGRENKFWCVIIAFVLALLAGCSDSPTWSADCRSPYDNWIATARTVEHSGFGTGDVETTVEIHNSHGSSRAERVLAFADGGRDIDLKMQWTAPSHLLVTYKADPRILYYQVLKTSGIEISAQNVPSDVRELPHPSAKP